MNPDKLQKLKSNMFPAAHGAIADWAAFPWHTHASSRRSSQMLAIDVFGTLSVIAQGTRDAILSEVATRAGVSPEGPWQVHLEWQDTRNLLRERTPTQVDAVAIGRRSILLFECKFTEAGGGCSQIKQDASGLAACDGRYARQVNPRDGSTSSCALSGKGIAYWEWIERVYGLSATSEHAPCPFAFDAYQWMRNVVLAAALREAEGKETRVIAAYADAPYLKTAWKVKRGPLGETPLSEKDAILPMPYDALLAIGMEIDPHGPWADLANWVSAKIEEARPKTA